MSSRKFPIALLAVVGLLLVTNSIWLFPHAGESTYTYERSAVTVEEGTFTYDGIDQVPFQRANDLQAVGCQWTDQGSERACAFDEHLVDHPPVTVSRQLIWGDSSPEFVEIDGTYYRRIHRQNGPNVTHDVTLVPARSVLRDAAVDVSDYPTPDRDEVSVEYYVALTGETVTTEERLEQDDLGALYRQDGTYYTVVGTDRTVHHPLDGVHRYDPFRYLLGGVGVVVLLAAGLLEVTRRSE